MEFNKAVLNVLKQRYLLRNNKGEVIEEPEEMFKRVGGNIAEANEQYDDDRTYKEDEEQFTKAMEQQRFMPNSPTLMNAGGELQQLAACFVLPIPDSMDGIYQAVKDTALIHQSGGGTGFSFSRIRPEGDVVQSTGGKASGPISFLKVFNESTNTVKQGGKRRGANMGILHVSHPDIYDWVTAKEDEEQFTNFNMSVAVDNEFMEAVKNEEEYDLINPRNGEKWDTIDAKQLYDKICQQAHQNGEPGIIFLDKINQENPFAVTDPEDDHYIEATNPCVTGDMKIAVADGRGAVQIKKLAEEGKDVPVYSLDDEGNLEIQMGRNPRETRENVEIVEIETDGKVKIKCTKDHEVVTNNGVKEAQNLEKGDSLKIMTKFDVTITDEESDVSESNYRYLQNGKENIMEPRIVARDLLDEEKIKDIKLEPELKKEKEEVTYKEFGDKLKSVPTTDLNNKPNSSLDEYREKYLDSELNKQKPIVKKNHKVVNLKEVGKEDVYNITVDKNHNYFCGKDIAESENNLVFVNTLNCGEQPLEPYGACNLGHINLSKAFDGENDVDWNYLENMVDLGVRFLDNVIDMSDYPIDEIEEKVSENRKIGLGVMGWHDLLMKLEIPYDSEEAVELAEEVMEFISEKAHEKSREIAEERGCFPAFDDSVYEDPRRNATLTTIAPTGTTSMIADCSSGIEPVFALTYQKQVMDSEKVTRTNDILEEKLKERGYWTEEIREEIKNKGSIKEIEELPQNLKEVFKTAMEINPEWHIRMQAAFQKGTDDAVSKTINFSEEADISDIKESYLLAYEEGCKGLTIYRNKSRENQALETQESSETEKGRILDKYDRNNWLEGKTKEMKMGCQKNLFVTCNADEQGDLREVFGVLGKPGGCIRSFIDSLGIVISIALQEGVEPEEIISKLKMIRCPNPDTLGEDKKYSCPDAIGRTMEDFIKENGSSVEIDVDGGNLPECPDCGGELVFEEGCVKCYNCGFSKC